MSKNTTLADAYPKALEKMREAIRAGEECGHAGAFYVANAKDLLRRASEAASQHDTVAMLKCYAEIEEFKL